MGPCRKAKSTTTVRDALLGGNSDSHNYSSFPSKENQMLQMHLVKTSGPMSPKFSFICRCDVKPVTFPEE